MEHTKESTANKQRVALVTGANQGVGFQIAKALAENGYKVYVGSRNLSNGEKAAAEIGYNAHAIELDVTKHSTITVQFLAEQLNFTPNYLSDMLRTLTGHSAQQHIHQRRIEKSKDFYLQPT